MVCIEQSTLCPCLLFVLVCLPRVSQCYQFLEMLFFFFQSYLFIFGCAGSLLLRVGFFLVAVLGIHVTVVSFIGENGL